MLKVSVFGLNGQEIEKIEIPENIFNGKINESLVAQAVRVYQSNKRQGNASTKTRGEVAGSTRKIYRQKGTGRARHGSLRAPIFVKGGIVFGPTPRDFSMNLPKKMKKIALYSTLSIKFKEQAIFIIDGLEDIKGKTKEMVKVLKKLKLNPDEEKILLILPEFHENIIRSFKNLNNSKIAKIEGLNALEALNSNKIIFTKKAIQKFILGEKVLNDQKNETKIKVINKKEKKKNDK